MRSFFSIIFLLFIGTFCHAQHVYQIKADSVRIYNTCDTAELILENRTQKVPGFLFNKGNGRTEFQQLRFTSPGLGLLGIQGQDTINLPNVLSPWGDARYDLLSTNFATLSTTDTMHWEHWYTNKPIGYFAYNAPDMPMLSAQAFNGAGSNTYYNGLVVKTATTGFDFSVNWNGELAGPNGAFIRIKDDTQTKWSQWRELLFKDYADKTYVLNQKIAAQAANLWISGTAEVGDSVVLTRYKNSAAGDSVLTTDSVGNLKLKFLASANGGGITGGSGMTLSGGNLNLGGTTTQNTLINLGAGNTFTVDAGNNTAGTITLKSATFDGSTTRNFSLGIVSQWWSGSSLNRIRSYMSLSTPVIAIGYTDSLAGRSTQLETNSSNGGLGFRHRVLSLVGATTRYYNFSSDSTGFKTMGDALGNYLFQMSRDSLLYMYTPNSMFTLPFDSTGYWVLSPTASVAPYTPGPLKAARVAANYHAPNYIWAQRGFSTWYDPANTQLATAINVEWGVKNTGAVYNKLVHTGDTNYNATSADYVIVCDSITANRTLQLLAGIGQAGRILIIQVKNAGGTFKWSTNVPFKVGDTDTTVLSTSQTLIYDAADSVWRQIAQ